MHHPPAEFSVLSTSFDWQKLLLFIVDLNSAELDPVRWMEGASTVSEVGWCLDKQRKVLWRRRERRVVMEDAGILRGKSQEEMRVREAGL